MKRLQPKNLSPAPVPPVFPSEKARLVQDIRDFVGKDGYVPMEHGFQPAMNASAFDENGMVLRHRIGREHRSRIEYDEMDETMLTNVIIDLFRYLNYCHLYA